MAQVYKSAGITVARMAGRAPAMDFAAAVLAGKAKMNAARARDTGATLAGIQVEDARGRNGVTDRLVVMEGEGALSIEFGHSILKISRSRGGRRASASVTHVPGKHIMRNALRDMPEVTE
ncbi:hypothetical protein ASF48_04945 [Rathayibacter sp. Leaf299]|uniref:DUF5403 family protein n=1 Tax=unclassified Rathayibacter TaxID=2609250 RepID=UPI0006F2EEF4|nr:MULTISPECIES: DUF5403 family protein [unclassified Rathayibacter]KQQ22533.1 hypothetical protein ASF48_04945 [Rathayibacter sp. Leaf299]